MRILPRKKRGLASRIPEHQRHTYQLKLRLSASVIATLRAHAKAMSMTVSAYVARLVEGYE